MSHSDKSVKLTLAAVKVLGVMFCVLMVVFPFIFKPFFTEIGLEKTFTVFIITFYACCPCAAVTLFCLNKLLMNVKNGIIFNSANIKLLKSLSISCFAASLISVPICFFMPIMLVFPLEALFMALILHVVKNVIEKGSEIKNENDLTI